MKIKIENIQDLCCFHHQKREAAARCVDCKRYFCRECTVLHDGKIVCTSCLNDYSKDNKNTRKGMPILYIAGSAAAFFAIWFFFNFLGQGLILLPSSFHNGTIW